MQAPSAPLSAPLSAPDGALIALPRYGFGPNAGMRAYGAQSSPAGKMTERTVEDTVADGAALNRMYAGWKAEMYAEFEGCAIVEAMQGQRFVAIAAFQADRKVIALWVAETRTLRFHGGAQSISVTGKILPSPTDPEALPEPFRTLALAAFAR